MDCTLWRNQIFLLNECWEIKETVITSVIAFFIGKPVERIKLKVISVKMTGCFVAKCADSVG